MVYTFLGTATSSEKKIVFFSILEIEDVFFKRRVKIRAFCIVNLLLFNVFKFNLKVASSEAKIDENFANFSLKA